MGIKFAKLTMHDWRQFAHLDIDFHDQLTVITGSNGAGKSTVLRLLAQHFGWNTLLLATPEIGKSGSRTYSSGLWRHLFKKAEPQGTEIGLLTYSNGSSAKLRVPNVGGVQYNVTIENQQIVEGLNIGSHRPISGYQQINNIPTNALGAEQAFSSYFQESMNRYNNAYTQFSPTYRMKEALISMAMFGPGNSYVEKNDKILQVFEGFKDILTRVLPKSIGFTDISVRIPDVVLVTDSGEFVIDASSGGIMSLIDLAWQIYLYSKNKENFVVILDEPENHLHPSMQRSILSSLLKSFPSAQFIVATHSPFIVSSVKDSHVYVLRHGFSSEASGPVDIKNSVRTIRLDNANKAGTAGEILRDVLGVPVTMPDWAEEEVRIIANEFEVETLTAESIANLRKRLEESGLGEFYPDALKQIVGKYD